MIPQNRRKNGKKPVYTIKFHFLELCNRIKVDVKRTSKFRKRTQAVIFPTVDDTTRNYFSIYFGQPS